MAPSKEEDHRNRRCRRQPRDEVDRRPAIHLSWLLLLVSILGFASVNGQDSSPAQFAFPQPSTAESSGSAPPPPSAPPSPSTSSSFVLADPNVGNGAYSPPAEPSPIMGQPSQTGTSAAHNSPTPVEQQQAPAEMGNSEQQQANVPSTTGGAMGGAGTGGYGSLMAVAAPADSMTMGQPMNDDAMPQAVSQQQDGQNNRMSDPNGNSAKRHQFSQYAVPPAPGVPGPAGGAPAGQCPGGASLPIECDPKRPWPQCPPQSYCYATNTVDIGPYFCCPIWSTYGAAWRPATPFYSYAPPPPPNWPEPMRMAAAPFAPGPAGPIRKGRKEQRFDEDGRPLMMDEEQRKILQVMNDWVERQKSSSDAVEQPPAAAANVQGQQPAEERSSDGGGGGAPLLLDTTESEASRQAAATQ